MNRFDAMFECGLNEILECDLMSFDTAFRKLHLDEDSVERLALFFYHVATDTIIKIDLDNIVE